MLRLKPTGEYVVAVGHLVYSLGHRARTGDCGRARVLARTSRLDNSLGHRARTGDLVYSLGRCDRIYSAEHRDRIRVIT